MAKILIAFNTLKEGFEELKEKHQVTFAPEGRDFTADELMDMVADYDVLCSVFDIPITKDLIAKGNNLKLISNYAVGYNNIDIDFAREKGIVVTNTPKSVVEPTAELAMALMMSCSRKTVELDRLMRQERDNLKITRLDRLGCDLYGKTIGIVGYGNIGEAVARRCRAFGMKVLYNKRNRLDETTEKERGLTYASLEEILKQCDVISVHTPYSSSSHHLFGEKEFGMMKSGAIFINTSRGAVVDEAALVKALQSGTIGAAGLDVFENKDIPTSQLYELENVCMTPHVGTQTYDARLSMIYELVDNVLGFLQDDRPISRVV